MDKGACPLSFITFTRLLMSIRSMEWRFKWYRWCKWTIYINVIICTLFGKGTISWRWNWVSCYLDLVTLIGYRLIRFTFRERFQPTVDLSQSVFQLAKDLGRVSCNLMEVTVVKQDGYPILFWLHPKKDKDEGNDYLHITYMESRPFPFVHELYYH